jgi:fatty acid CoA ligase FadD36
VERVVEAVPGVEDAAVVSVPDDEYGEVLAAFVVGSATAEQILEAARRELASFKVPRSVRLVDELPRTSTGKIRAPELRRLVEEDGDAGAGAPV